MSPTAPGTPCPEPGCPEITPPGTRCDEHERSYARQLQRKRRDDPDRATRVYDSRRWQKVRARYRKAHPLCERCEQGGIVEPMAEVHHVVPINEGGEPFDWDNLEALCRPCHRRADRGAA